MNEPNLQLNRKNDVNLSAKKFFKEGPPAGPLAVSASMYFPSVEFRPVQTVEEVKAAASLVYTEYLSSGFIKPASSSLKLSLHQILPTTKTFVAVHQPSNTVVATLTTIEDSPFGLPMDSFFAIELIALRLDGHHLAEYSRFAVNRAFVEKELHYGMAQRRLLVFHLIRAAFDGLRIDRRVTTMVECCHPTHDGFYQSMGMIPFDGVRCHHGVEGNPATGRYLSLARAMKEGPSHTAARLFLRDLPAIPPKSLRLSETDIREFFVRQSNLLQSAKPHQLAHIKACYPTYDIEGLARSRPIFDYVIESLEYAKSLQAPSDDRLKKAS